MRDDNRYEYNMDVSRTLAQRGAGSMTNMSSSLAQYPQDISLLSPGGMPASYRSNGYPNVNTKGYYYSMATDLTDAYGADGGVDYGLSCPPYQVIHSEPIQMPVAQSYGTWAAARPPKNTTQGSGGGGGSGGAAGLYLDSESAYGAYGTGSNTSLVHRPAVSVAGDSSPYSFSGFAASLPSAGATSSTSGSNGSERLLPTPVSRGVGGGSSAAAASNAYRTDGLPAATSCYASSKPGQSPSAVSGAGNGIQASPTSPLSDITGYASSAYDYATGGAARSSHQQQQHHHHHQHHHAGSSTTDVYASVSTNGGAETIFGDSDRSAGTQGSAVDLSGYTYGAASPAETSSLRRASSGSGLTSRSTADSSSTGSAGYVGSDHGTGAYHHPSSSSSHGPNHHHQQQQQHGHHHHHHQQQQQQHAAAQHHNSSRHGSHHISEQRMVAGSNTTYGAGSNGSHSGAGSGMGSGGLGNTTAASHRPTVATRR